MLVRSGAIDVVVIDSVAALTPRAEIEGDMGDSHVGLQARLMSQALRKLTANLNKTDTICIFINQLREKIGVMFGSPETTPGGRALKFYSSVRLDIRRIESIKDGVEVVGNRTRVKVVKNKCAPPFRQAEFDIMYGKGISREGGVLDIGVDNDIVKKSGAWYTYEGEQLGQGRENAKQFLTDNPEIMIEISERIRTKMGIGEQRGGQRGRRRARARPRRPADHPGASRSRPKADGIGGSGQKGSFRSLSNHLAVMEQLKVSTKSNPNSVAGAMAGVLRQQRRGRGAGGGSRGPEPGHQGCRHRPGLRRLWWHRPRVRPELRGHRDRRGAAHGHPARDRGPPAPSGTTPPRSQRWPRAPSTGSPTSWTSTVRPTWRPSSRLEAVTASTDRDPAGAGACCAPSLAAVTEPRRYLIRTFGCQMNEHDSERIAGLLEADGLVADRPTPRTPTSSCSTPAASARTPTTSSTARSATSSR